MAKKLLRNTWPYFIVLILILIIEIPQLISGHIILGSDTIFHYNRFYDSAMQIAHLNFNYFASNYGYNQCGRIVNAVYSPYFSYLQGFLMLLCRNYFNYQIVSDVLVFLLASISLTIGLKIARLWVNSDKFLVMLYPFTYQVAHWTVSTNFTAWGTIILPLAVGCVVRMFTDFYKPINSVQFGLITALIIQVHFVTSLEMFIIYIIFIPFAWYRAFNRKQFFMHLLAAALLTILLDLNIIGGLLETFSHNHITPLTRLTLQSERIFSLQDDGEGRFITSAIFLLTVLLALIVLRQQSKVAWNFGALSIVFYVLSMPLPIWRYVFANNRYLGVIQYPSRLLVPAMTLSAFFLGFILKEDILNDWVRELVEVMGCLFIACATVANFATVKNYSNVIAYNPSIRPMAPNKKSKRIRLVNIQKGAHSSNYGFMLHHAYQGVADYMPMSRKIPFSKGPSNKVYWDNMHIIFESQNDHHQFSKYSEDHRIITEYKLKKYQKVTLPLVKYHHTHIKVDGLPLSDYNPKYKNFLKAPTIYLNKGRHTITSVYTPNWSYKMTIPISILTWIIVLISYIIWRAAKYNEKLRKIEQKRRKPLYQALPKGHY